MAGILKPFVEVEEDVYTYEPADNGAGPLWCFGGTTLVRVGSQVFATGLETIPQAKPLINCRWMLFGRHDDGRGWELIYKDMTARTREPAPMACFDDGRFFVSVNPSRAPLDSRSGPAEPQVLEFSAADPKSGFKTCLPAWAGEPKFCEHSYRTFVADGRHGELLLMQQFAYDRSYWSFRDRTGEWSACGQLFFPWGADYVEPCAIRLCYPNVAMINRAVHFFGMSDIVEPNPAFRDYKFHLTGKKWDYDMRRLFYSWTPDIVHKPFGDWIEIASRDKTCGNCMQCDLHVDGNGLVHLLWHDKSLDLRLRDKFFPGEKLTIALEYAVISRGQIVRRQTLAIHEENSAGAAPSKARFHVMDDGRLLVIASFQGTQNGESLTSMRLIEIRSDGTAGKPLTVDFKSPFTDFFHTATPRGGSCPSPIIDLLGHGAGKDHTIQYARVQLGQTV